MEESDKIPKVDKRKGAYANRVNLSVLRRRILHVVNVQVIHMVKLVNSGQSLEKKDQEALIKYGKFIDELVKEQEKAVETLDTELLSKRVQDET